MEKNYIAHLTSHLVEVAAILNNIRVKGRVLGISNRLLATRIHIWRHTLRMIVLETHESERRKSGIRSLTTYQMLGNIFCRLGADHSATCTILDIGK